MGPLAALVETKNFRFFTTSVTIDKVLLVDTLVTRKI